jgi:L-ascorbate metabolism protein UlaG (beta-lactamase superfamily)
MSIRHDLKDALYTRLFPRYRPQARYHTQGSASGAAIRIQWLGIAGYAIDIAGTVILIDPYFSRPGFRALASTRLDPKLDEIARFLPPKVDAVVCGHSHFDHAADAPFIAKRTGALLIGSRSTCNWGRSAGLPESQLCEMPGGGAEVRVGEVTVRMVASKHGRAVLGRIPLQGSVEQTPIGPGRFWHYRMGGAFGVLLKSSVGSIYHNGSADLVDHELDGERADVLLACLAGRKGTERYLGRLVDALHPGLIVPSHYDAFFAPIDAGLHLLPNLDVDGLMREAHTLAPQATLLTPDYLETVAFGANDARSALIASR